MSQSIATFYSILQARISCDVRWQLASEAVDGRYVGSHVGLAKPKAGLYAEDNISEQENNSVKEKKVNINELKEKWSLQLNVEQERHLNEEWGPFVQ